MSMSTNLREIRTKVQAHLKNPDYSNESVVEYFEKYLGFVMGGHSFLPVGIEKGQSISSAVLLIRVFG